jgi:hypothetical protein
MQNDESFYLQRILDCFGRCDIRRRANTSFAEADGGCGERR